MDIGPSDPDERREIEIRNLDEVEAYLKWLAENRPGFSVSESLILELHRLTVKDLYSCAGKFRTPVYRVVVTSDTLKPAKTYEIQYQIRDLIEEYRSGRAEDLEAKFKAAVRFFHKFLQIHPFCGGNGRVARSLLNHMLRRDGLLGPDASISYYLKRRNDRYLRALQEADQGSLLPLEKLIDICAFEAVFDGFYDFLASKGKLSLLSSSSSNVRIYSQEERLKMSDAELDSAFSNALVEMVDLLNQLTLDLRS